MKSNIHLFFSIFSDLKGIPVNWINGNFFNIHSKTHAFVSGIDLKCPFIRIRIHLHNKKKRNAPFNSKQNTALVTNLSHESKYSMSVLKAQPLLYK